MRDRKIVEIKIGEVKGVWGGASGRSQRVSISLGWEILGEFEVK